MEFNVNILNLFTLGVTPVNQMMTNMKTIKKLELLSHFLSLVTRSKEFGLHRPEMFSEEGFRLDGNGVTEQVLEAAGGTLEEYKAFLNLAKTSAQDPPCKKRKIPEEKRTGDELDGNENVKDDDTASKPAAKRATKVTDFFERKEKENPSKSEILEKNFQEVIKDHRTLSRA